MSVLQEQDMYRVMRMLTGQMGTPSPGGGGAANIVILTQDEYLALAEAGTIVEDTLYLISDEDAF